MHRYMQHMTSQQAANHRGQVQLNKTFYRYNMHEQSQDPCPFPWPTPEQFRATVAWPGDETNFEGAQGDDDMADVLDLFT